MGAGWRQKRGTFRLFSPRIYREQFCPLPSSIVTSRDDLKHRGTVNSLPPDHQFFQLRRWSTFQLSVPDLTTNNNNHFFILPGDKSRNNCCGASVASEQKHIQDLEEWIKGRRILELSTFYQNALDLKFTAPLLPECIAPRTIQTDNNTKRSIVVCCPSLFKFIKIHI